MAQLRNPLFSSRSGLSNSDVFVIWEFIVYFLGVMRAPYVPSGRSINCNISNDFNMFKTYRKSWNIFFDDPLCIHLVLESFSVTTWCNPGTREQVSI